MSVLVSGGAGFIGSHLVEKLLSEDYEVFVVDNLFSGRVENLNLRSPKVHFLKGDIRDKAAVSKTLKNVEYVFHLAAIIDVPFSISNPSMVNDVNVNGTLNLLNESMNYGNIKRFIYASSCSVYGEPVYLPIDESHPTNPLSPYAVSKLAAEKYCQVFNEVYGLATVCLRFFNVYGPRQDFSHYSNVISNFIRDLRSGKAPVIFGDGLQTRDFVYVDDVVDCMLKTLLSKGCVGETINVGSGVETSIRKLADLLISMFNLNGVRPENREPRKGDIKRSWANIEKAKRVLGYEPKFSLEAGLKKLLSSSVH